MKSSNCCLLNQGIQKKDTMVFWNVGMYLSNNTASHPNNTIMAVRTSNIKFTVTVLDFTYILLWRKQRLLFLSMKFVCERKERQIGRYVHVTTIEMSKSMDQSPCWEANIASIRKEVPGILRNTKLITMFTRVQYLSLFSATLIQPMPSLAASIRCTSILSSCLSLFLQSGLFPSGFSPKTLYTICLLPRMFHMRMFTHN